MRILVTGASGFVGRPLVSTLAKAGHCGFAISRSPNLRVPDRWKSLVRPNSLLDLRLTSDVDSLLHLEVKQHVTNPTSVDIGEFQRVNVEGTQQWLDWAAKHNVDRFVYFSSIKAVGGSSLCQDENANSLPDSPYGASKREAERRVAQWAQEDSSRSALILRPAVICGPGNQGNMFSLIHAIHRNRFFLIGKSGNIKSLISIKNLTAAVVHLISIPLKGCHTFNLTDAECYSVWEIAAIVSRRLGRKRPIRALPYSLARVCAFGGDVLERFTGIQPPLTTPRLRALTETTHFSCAKLMDTGFKHPQTGVEGIEETVEWYMDTKSEHLAKA